MSHTLGIMQPYFFPYIGYFQLINLVDEFIVYDNIQFSKSGWIHRNRMLSGQKDVFFTIPLKKDSDYLDVCNREISEIWESERLNLLRRIEGSYKKAKNFEKVYPFLETCFRYEEKNLFLFILHSLKKTLEFLAIETPLRISSSIEMDHKLKGADRVLEICRKTATDLYINPIGGTQLYSKEDFAREGVHLKFLRTRDFTYDQNISTFVPYLSIIDVMMFNDFDVIKHQLSLFTLE